MKTLKYTFALLAITLFTVSCSDDDPVIVNEEEVITTMTVELVATGQTTVTLRTRDLDGDGPDAPIVSVSGPLAANTTYTGSIELLDETDLNDVDNITLEVEEEDEEHQFFFTSTVGTVAYADADANGNPVGLSFTLTTGAAGSGNFTVTLRHEPVKDAAGVSDGDITNAGGETDITETFPVTVQ
ncbi:hypothetical protein DFQ05_0718 [Winogradskyella wandonensis]|uniref:Type 1 periplasmic binding fold superfamily protein n=1 Tax=Winogradskyella wandonensis TaxID=1442586 RepID=A0A4R1KVK7_9FLAO|nr:type 1 periplasmic binding fold superfamily protein [Winogradskyella wandonensis]TCK69198.1 hypothetical protein DFQ05_0718 [Winogradskyella wandonensis]